VSPDVVKYTFRLDADCAVQKAADGTFDSDHISLISSCSQESHVNRNLLSRRFHFAYYSRDITLKDTLTYSTFQHSER